MLLATSKMGYYTITHTYITSSQRIVSTTSVVVHLHCMVATRLYYPTLTLFPSRSPSLPPSLSLSLSLTICQEVSIQGQGDANLLC